MLHAEDNQAERTCEPELLLSLDEAVPSVHVIVHIRKSFSFFPVRLSPLGGDNLFPVELLHYGQK